MLVFKDEFLVIDVDKVTHLLDVGYGYWQVHFIGGSFQKIGRDTAESIRDIMEANSQHKTDSK